MEEKTAQTQAELEAILGILTELTGLPSRWSGNVELVPNAEFKGRKPFRCDIEINAALAEQDERWPTLIHEVLHSIDLLRNWPGINSRAVKVRLSASADIKDASADRLFCPRRRTIALPKTRISIRGKRL